jgi:hypothetical protein
MKYTFTLKNVLASVQPTNSIRNNTSLGDLLKTTSINFIDDSKHTRKCQISVINSTNNNCFWCRHPIPKNVVGVGCPINHIPAYVVKTYFSEISKDNFSIKEYVTNSKIDDIDKTDTRITSETNDIYEVDGIFCSFNCCLAFINDNKHNTVYKKSEFYLLSCYKAYTGTDDIKPAPSWRLLSEYGGSLSITEFRESFGYVEYINHGRYVIQYPIGNLYEKKINI